jgi:hypothetical protein
MRGHLGEVWRSEKMFQKSPFLQRVPVVSFHQSQSATLIPNAEEFYNLEITGFIPILLIF